MKVRYATLAAVTVAALFATAAECDTTGPDPIAGIVIGRVVDGTHYLLKVRKNDGKVIVVRETFANWARCKQRTFYPNCKYIKVRNV